MSISLRDRLFVVEPLSLDTGPTTACSKQRSKNNSANDASVRHRAESVPRTKDKMGRRGLRVCDLLDPETLPQKIGALVAEKNRELEALKYPQSIEPGPICDSYTRFGEKIKGFVCDTSVLLNGMIREGKRVLFEGAQGRSSMWITATFPYVTSSSAAPAAFATGLGISPKHVHRVIGISKAYTTRVGGGPFPTESDDGPGGQR